MDAGAAASFYRRKGYTVRENVRATGASGNEHKVPLLAEGPLGSLAVFFGDLGGIDGPEMGGARKVARDLGATPVLAAAEFSNPDRQTAARLGVVLLDDDAVGVEVAPAAPPPPADPARAWPGLVPIPAKPRANPESEAHPWPASGRVGGRDGPGSRAIDVDDLLAPRQRQAPVAATATVVQPAAAPAAAPEPLATGETDSFWTMPRRPASTPRPQRPAAISARPFAWLDGPGTTTPAPAASGTAAEYDGVVSSRAAPAAGDGLSASVATEAPPSPDERAFARPLPAEVLERRARLQRRLGWALAAAVLVYLFLKWWY